MVKNARHSDEQGIAHLLLAVLLVVVIAIIGLAGWRVVTMSRSSSTNSTGSNANTTSSNHTSDTSNSGSNSSVETQCLALYHDSNLCHFAAFSTSIEKMAYAATLTSTQDGVASSMTLKQDGKGNNELTTTAEGQTVSTVTYNGKMYVRSDSSSPWIVYPSGVSAPATTEDPADKMDFALSNVGVTFKSQGTERCGSLTCFKYQVNDKATPNVTQYVWFDNSQYKLREWQYAEGSSSVHMALSYDNVTITAPSPVQSL